MAFEYSQTFLYTGQPTTWEKPLDVRYANFVVKGPGGAGSPYAGGGGGGYVFSQYQYLNPYVAQTVYINVGGGGKSIAPRAGGVSPGGTDLSYNNGGDGTASLTGFTSGGGGGMSSIVSYDRYNNRVINIIAGGGGGGGSLGGGTGGAGGQGIGTAGRGVFGKTGSGVGGGEGGNTNTTGPSGNGGDGGLTGGVNGYDYEFLQPTDISFNGGGGGSGGSFAGGGGGAGYGGGAGGRRGGGGGGGSFGNGLINSYIDLGGIGGAGGAINMAGGDGFITVQWTTASFLNDPIVNMFMLNPQHTNSSIYAAPARDPLINVFITTSTLANPYATTINFDGELCLVGGDGKLYLYNHDQSLLWSYTCPTSGYIFAGTPALSRNGTIYVSTVKTTIGSSVGYLYAIIDINNTPLIKWTFQLNGNPTISPVIDVSDNIFLGTSASSIYSISDQASTAILNWKYDISYNPTIAESAIAMNRARTQLCVSSSSTATNTSRFIVLDISNNISPTRTRWSVDISGVINSPSIDGSLNYVYFSANNANTISSYVYGYNISAVSPTPLWAPISVGDINLSSIAIGRLNKMYVTSKYGLNMLDRSIGRLDWKYIIPISDGSANLYNSVPVIDASDNVLFGSSNYYVYSCNGLERFNNWSFLTNGSIVASPVIGSNNDVWVSTNNGRIYNLSGNAPIAPTYNQIIPMYMLNTQHTGKSIYINDRPSTNLYWSYEVLTTGNLYVLPAFAMDASFVLYAGSGDGYLYAFNSYDDPGHLDWRTQLPVIPGLTMDAPNSIYTTPLISPSNVIYVGTNNGYLHAVGSNGVVNWSYNTGTTPLQSSPIISALGVIYFASGANLYAIRDQGEIPYNYWLQAFTVGGTIYSSPALSLDEGTVYFGSNDGYIYAISAVHGTQNWRFSTNGGVPLEHPIFSSPTVDASDNIIVGNGSYMNGVLYSLSPSGNKNWDFSFNQQPIGPYYNTVAINGNTIYLSTIAYLFAINRVTGVPRWTYNTNNMIPYVYYSTVTIDANGKLYFSAINAINGDCDVFSATDTGSIFSIVWQVNVGNNCRLSQPVMDDDGHLYVNSTDNRIYALL